MKYKMLFWLAAFLSSPLLFAFIPGDAVLLPEKNGLSWSNCSPMPLGALTGKEKQKYPPYRAVVFFRPRAENSEPALLMLEQLHRQNSALLLIAAIAPDPLSEVKKIQERHPDYRIRMAADREQQVTNNFLAGTILFPMAYLIDEDGIVLWRGEAVDLAEAFLQAKNGTLDRKTQRKIAPMISELLQQMRSGDDPAVYQTSRQIFAADPGNATTLRIQLFLLENKGNYTGAKDLVWAQIKSAPSLLRLYFTMLDLMRRHPELRSDLPALSNAFFEHAALPEEVIGFARYLVDYFPDDTAALTAAADLLAAVDKDLPSSVRPLYLTVRALLAYRFCDLAQAIRFQQQAVDEIRKSGKEEALANAEKQLRYYQKIQELQGKYFPAEK